jgi:release factor glutamine methyltransferase
MTTIAEALRSAERALTYRASREDCTEAPDEARIEAETLLMHAVGTDRAHLLAGLQEELTEAQRATFRTLVTRRLDREPLSYIVGTCEFFGVELTCTPAALIPRPETEMLVELALDEIQRRGTATRIADIGTGTGAIAIAIAANELRVTVVASDVSLKALELARANASRADVPDRVMFVDCDLLTGLGEFDVIVANLPYVSDGDWRELALEIRSHEPKSAIAGGAHGLEIVERLLHDAPAHLAPGGVLAAEIGDTHGRRALAIGRACFPAAEVCVMKDFAGLDRMLVVRT